MTPKISRDARHAGPAVEITVPLPSREEDSRGGKAFAYLPLIPGIKVIWMMPVVLMFNVNDATGRVNMRLPTPHLTGWKRIGGPTLAGVPQAV